MSLPEGRKRNGFYEVVQRHEWVDHRWHPGGVVRASGHYVIVLACECGTIWTRRIPLEDKARA